MTQPTIAPGHRPLSTIAAEIREEWQPQVHEWAEPYVAAMEQLHSINDNYFEDSARSVINYFLSNCSSWRGPEAKRIKNELRRMVGAKEAK